MTTSLGRLLIPAVLCSIALAQQWTAPQPGWIYVLDVGRPASGGRVLLADPVEGVVRGVIPTGYAPDFGLCPDGSRLYISHGPHSSGLLSGFATNSGQSIGTALLRNRAVYKVRPSAAGVGCSSDGKWVFVQKMSQVSAGSDQHSLAGFNVNTAQPAEQEIPLPSCGVARFVPLPRGGWDVAVECSSSNTVRFASLTTGGSVSGMQDVALTLAPPLTPDGTRVNHGQRITTSVLGDRDGGTLTFVRGAGGIDQVNARTLALSPKANDGWQRFSPPGGAVWSARSGLIYVGSMPYGQITAGGGWMDSIDVFEAADLTHVTTLRVTAPFTSLAVSADGGSLYTVHPADQSVTLFDTATLKEIRTIRGLGEEPVLVLVQP